MCYDVDLATVSKRLGVRQIKRRKVVQTLEMKRYRMSNIKSVARLLNREKNGRAIRVDGRKFMKDFNYRRMTDGRAESIATRLEQHELYVHIVTGRNCKWDFICISSLEIAEFSTN